MNPIFQAVIARTVAELRRRCPSCDGRVVASASGKHSRFRCERCGADVQSPRTARSVSTAGRRAERTRGKGLFGWVTARRNGSH
jgi:tRNA(Ile2) C34 agmatinyltransferase TiaS